MGFTITAGPGRTGVLSGTEERALDGNGRGPSSLCTVPFDVSTWGKEGVRASEGSAACRAGVASWRGGSDCVTPFAVFVSRKANKADRETYP
jgi:hypothetical protein